MERPEHIPQALWEKHLDWLNVTGETSRRHIRELRSGELARRYYADEGNSQERAPGKRTADRRAAE